MSVKFSITHDYLPFFASHLELSATLSSVVSSIACGGNAPSLHRGSAHVTHLSQEQFAVLRPHGTEQTIARLLVARHRTVHGSARSPAFSDECAGVPAGPAGAHTSGPDLATNCTVTFKGADIFA